MNKSKGFLRKFLNNKKLLELIVTIIGAVIIAIITYDISYKQCLIPSDYSAHIQNVKKMEAVGVMKQPYFLWHGLTLVLSYFLSTKLSICISAAVSTMIFNVLCYVAADRYFKEFCGIWHGAVSLLLMIVEPIFLPSFTSNIYTGHCGSPNSWHNPTQMCVRPFAILTFLVTIRICNAIKENNKVERRDAVLFAVSLLLSVLGKPSFFQGFFPAYVLYLFIILMLNKFKNIRRYVMAALYGMPAVLIVFYQFFYEFFGGAVVGKSGIGFEWGKVAHFSTKNMPIAFVLVMLFPLLYFGLNYKKLIKQTDIQLAILFVFVSYIEMGLLYEKGDQMYDGNFMWSIEIAYFISWMICLSNYVKDWINSRKNYTWKETDWVLLSAMIMHIYSGIAYINQLVFIPGRIY